MSQIRIRREKRNLTQAQLAEKVGVSEITVRLWELGKRTPRIYRLKQMAKVLKCRAADLL